MRQKRRSRDSPRGRGGLRSALDLCAPVFLARPTATLPFPVYETDPLCMATSSDAITQRRTSPFLAPATDQTHKWIRPRILEIRLAEAARCSMTLASDRAAESRMLSERKKTPRGRDSKIEQTNPRLAHTEIEQTNPRAAHTQIEQTNPRPPHTKFERTNCHASLVAPNPIKMAACACMIAFIGPYFHRNPRQSPHEFERTNPRHGLREFERTNPGPRQPRNRANEPKAPRSIQNRANEPKTGSYQNRANEPKTRSQGSA